MRFFIKLLITLVVLAVLLPFTILKGKDGRPLMSLDRLKAPELSVPKLPVPGNRKRQDLIYRWVDDSGIVHFTNTPPPAGVAYTVKGYDPDTNLIQSVRPTAATEPEPVQPVQSKSEKQPSSLKDIGNPYSIEKVEKLMDDAKNVQHLLEDRAKRQEQLISGQ